MRVLSAIVVSLGCLVTAACALPSPSTHVVHERRDALPQGWTKRGLAPRSMEIPLSIALTQSNLHKLEEYLLEVSHPSSEKFGHHWGPARIAETFAPSAETLDSVSKWLHGSGIAAHRIEHSDSKGWLKAKLAISEAEALLNTRFHIYEHSSGYLTVAVDEYSVPDHIKHHIDFITPTLHFDMRLDRENQKRDLPTTPVKSATGRSIGDPGQGITPKQRPTHTAIENSTVASLANCSSQITPACLRALYSLPLLSGWQESTDALGIVEYSPQAYLLSDMVMFLSTYAPSGWTEVVPNTVSIDGGYPQTVNQSFSYNGESDLDLQYAFVLSQLKTTLFQVGDPYESGSFSNFLDALDGTFCQYNDPDQDALYPDSSNKLGSYKGSTECGGVTPTKVISTSYGYNEADLTLLYETRQCNEYAKLALSGVSFIFSSGDYGVAGNEGECIDPTTGEYNSGTSGRFNPSYPGTCPYGVTSVGATQVKTGASVTEENPEQACDTVIYSGGGFSDRFDLPSYQASAVQSYFDNYPPPYTATQYNNSRTSRGIPDVAANGANYVVAVDGEFQLVYGTSASAPTFASILSRVNEARARVGKSSVGYVNPTFYAHPEVFTDITAGDNPGCGTNGFSAVPGWDPVTGLGTPNYSKLEALYLSLP